MRNDSKTVCILKREYMALKTGRNDHFWFMYGHTKLYKTINSTYSVLTGYYKVQLKGGQSWKKQDLKYGRF